MGRHRLILLDTHAWIWWVSDPDQLGRTARPAVSSARRIGISAISCWEFAMLAARKRISIDRAPAEWMEVALALPGTELLPISPRIAAASAELGDGFPGDPADRLIVATAKVMGGILITKDERLLKLQAVESVW